ncbi:Hypothetical_protein [Hexamita inflata]|uniref:Hypothetical_protein n=1 Tax=Hexamita inflata TaxID=28002 RepID=A0AA86PDW8_9EUKA|nr:Hypothetical protein HINF_LOCUS24965 [Hexamita inflata]
MQNTIRKQQSLTSLKLVKHPSQMFQLQQPQKYIPILRRPSIQQENSESMDSQSNSYKHSISNCQIKNIENDFDLFCNHRRFEKIIENDDWEMMNNVSQLSKFHKLRSSVYEQQRIVKSLTENCCAFEYLLEKIQKQIDRGVFNSSSMKHQIKKYFI